jgi:hypothetical protein
MQEHGFASVADLDRDGGTSVDGSLAKVASETPRRLLVER